MATHFQRVAVVGATGTGKTTLTRELCRLIDAPHIELDAARYEADWHMVSEKAFRDKVVASVGTDRWVVEGNYTDVQDLIWIRAQLLVWLDFPLRVVLWRLLRRTFLRLLTGEVFASGTREQLSRILGKRSIFIWAIRSHRRRRRLYEELLATPRYAHLQVVRLRSPSAVEDWLAGVSEPAQRPRVEST
jgi:adenylate kinase family enzyme